MNRTRESIATFVMVATFFAVLTPPALVFAELKASDHGLFVTLWLIIGFVVTLAGGLAAWHGLGRALDDWMKGR